MVGFLSGYKPSKAILGPVIKFNCQVPLRVTVVFKTDLLELQAVKTMHRAINAKGIFIMMLKLI
jgi:hypothetical protein